MLPTQTLRRVFGTFAAISLGLALLAPQARGADAAPPIALKPWQEEAVGAALQDPSLAVRSAALLWLADRQSGNGPLIEAVTEVLRTPQPTAVKTAAAQFLGHGGSDAAAAGPTLAALLADPDQNAAQAAANALAPNSMVAARTAAAPQLAALLKAPRTDTRFYAARLLGDLGDTSKPYAPQIAALLEDGNLLVRRAAAVTLSYLGPTELAYAEHIVPLLYTQEPLLGPLGRKDVAQALVRLGSVEAVNVPRILQNLKDPEHPAARMASAYALGDLAALGPTVTATAPQVAALLADKDVDVRLAATRALGMLAPASAAFIPKLAAAALQDPSDLVRVSAAQSVSQLGAADALAPRIATLLSEQNPDVRMAAVEALDGMGVAPRYAPQIAALLADDKNLVALAAENALVHMGPAAAAVAPQIAGLLKGPSSYHATEALGKMGPAASGVARQIAEMLTDPALQDRALTALAAMGPAAAAVAPQVAARLPQGSDNRTALTALGNMGSAAAATAPQVAALLSSTNSLNPFSAAKTLGLMGAAAGAFAPKIAGLLSDPAAGVRKTAAEALGLIGSVARPQAPRLANLLADAPVSQDSLQALDRIASSAPLTDRKILLDCLSAAHTLPAQAPAVLLRAYVYRSNSPDDLLLIRWLGNRSSNERPDHEPLDQDAARHVLAVLSKAWPEAKDFPGVREEMAARIADLARSNDWEIRDLPALAGLYALLAPAYPSQALTVRAAAAKNRWAQRLRISIGLIGAHIAAWIILIFAYPRLPVVQSFFFWNKWARRFLGAGYVSVLITTVPWLRRRMFLPFRESLLPRAQLEQLNEAAYFAGSRVFKEQERRMQGEALPLEEALPGIRGQVVLKGASGLGKTLLLLRLGLAAREPVVFLRATECGHGVLAAIRKKLHGTLRDADYLRKLIHNGGLKVLIDGLNEATPDARARVTQFVEEHFRGDLILTTQPTGWEPPATASVYVLQPLLPEQIEPFLLRQWDGVQNRATVSHSQYEAVVSAYVKGLPAAEASSQPASQHLAVPQLTVLAPLANPMDATLAAELLARGKTPDAFGLVEQRYKLTSAGFREQEGREFPLRRFAERVYEWRVSGEPDMPIEGFEAEVGALARDRLMLTRSERIKKDKGEEESRRWFFRHDKITDFFLLPAFLDEPARREQHALEERFWGLYELLAVRLNREEEERLLQFLVRQAALTARNELLNRYAVARRARAASDADRASMQAVAT